MEEGASRGPATCYISNDACGTNTQPFGPVRLGQFTRRIDDASSGSLVRFPRQVPFERGSRGERIEGLFRLGY